MPGNKDPRREQDPLELIGVELLGRYQIQERIASGGMSVVYRGADRRLHRPVCVKVFSGIDPAKSAYQTSYEHFVQEAFALSQLQHPNTLRIYDFGYLEKPPRPFHVSELLEGGTLSAHIAAHGALSAAGMLEILEPVTGSLSEAHSRGIVHRDIKPSNILFGQAGPRRIVKLADFGIAKAQEVPNRAQDTKAASGRRLSLYSPGWAAPEQLRALPVGPSADVFSLGLVAAFIMTARKIYAAGSDVEVFEERAAGDQHVERAVTAMQLPEPVEQVLLRSLRVTPMERYDTADQWLASMRAAVKASELDESGIRTTRFDKVEAAEPVLTISTAGADEVLAAGRRVRLIPVAEQVDLGGDGPLRSPARARLTIFADADRRVRVHVKGLNCFVAKRGGRPSSAVDLDSDAELELLAPDRERLDALRFAFGVPSDDGRQFHLGGVTLSVPRAEAPAAVIVDLGPGRELALLHRPGRPAGGPKR
jgi:serine/threonine-protein kinase